jgi:hypothetical protein
MAIDIATIGIEMDTSSVKAGTADLNKAAIAGQKLADSAQSSAKVVEQAEARKGAAFRESAKEAERAARKIQDDVEKSARAAQNQSRGVMQNFGWQMQDAIVQLQMGTSAAVVFSQQGSQLASAFNPLLGMFVAIAGVVGGALLSGFTNTGEAAEDVRDRVMKLVQELKSFNDEQKKIVEAALVIEIEKQTKSIEDQTSAIEKQRKEVEKLKQSQDSLTLTPSSGFGGLAGVPSRQEFDFVDNTEKIKKESEELIAAQTKLVELQGQLAKMQDPENKRGLLDSLEEEATLAGLVGEALYRQEAALKNLSGTEADRYVQLNLEIQQKEESLALAQKQEKQIEKLEIKQTAYTEKLLAGLQREADLYGITSREAQITYDIKNGLIEVEGGLNGQIAQSLILNAQRIDQMSAQKSATDEYVESLKKWVDEQNKLAEAAPIDAQNLIDGVNNLGGAWSRTGSIIVDTFGSIADALDDYQARQNAIAEQEKKNAEYKAKYINNPEQMKVYYAAEKKLSDERTKSQLSGFKSMAGAASQMFGEQSKARKTLHQIEMGLSAVELAMSIKNTATEIALSFSRGTAAATEGVANQSKGDPYSAWARMAAMAAVMAGLGFAVGGVGGGGGGTNVQAVQESQGTGSVLGSNDKSASLANTMEMYADIGADQLVELRAIRENTAKFNGGIAQLSLGVSASGLAEAKYVNFADQYVGDIIDRGGLVTRGSRSQDIAGREMLAPLQGQISNIFGFIQESINSATGALELAQSNPAWAFISDIGKVSFKDMSGEEIQAELEAIFSQQADLITGFVVPAMKEYQQMGEGLFETLTRVAKEQAIFNDYMQNMGLSMEGVSSIMAIDMAQSIAEMMGGFDNFTDAASSYVDKFFSDQEKFDMLQRSLSETFAALGVSMPTTTQGFRDLVEGIDRTTTEGQRLFAALLEINPSFAEFAEQLADTNNNVLQERIDLENQLKQLTQTENEKRAEQLASLDASNRALQEQIYAIQDQAAAVKESEAAAKLLASQEQAITNQRLSLESKLLQAQGNTAALRAIELEKLDESNKSIQIQIWALEDQKSANEAMANAAEKAANEIESAANAEKARAEAIASERYGLETQLLQLLGDTDALRQRERDQISESNKALYDQIKALEDQQEAAKLAEQAAADASRAQAEALNDARRAAEEQRKLAQGVHDSISDALRSLMGQSDSLAGLTQQQARNTLQSALSVAKAGGSLVGFAGLEDALGAIQQLDASKFSTGEDYRAAMGANIGLLSQLEKYTKVNGSHATGLDYVPFDGYIAKLHRGERVQTASEAKNGDAILGEIRNLLSDINSGTIASNTKLLNMRQMLDKWDGDGLPQERVA